MKQFLTYLFIALFAISAVSCKKDKDENENGKVQLIKTMTFYDNDNSELSTYHYEYDDKDRLTSLSVHDEFIFNIMYSGDDEDIIFIQGQRIDCSKNGNLISVDGGSFNGTIELNSDGYPIVLNYVGIYYPNPPFCYQYFDKNIEYVSSSGGGYCHFKFDNKKSPLYYCQTPIWIYLLMNPSITNMIVPTFGFSNNAIYLKSHTIKDELVETTDIFSFTYEYDNNCFPTKMYWDGKLYATFTY